MNKNQIKTIKTVLKNSVEKEEDIPKVLMMFIVDMSFERAAICQAEKEFRQEQGYEKP